jgi:SRSO17 transposase
MNEPKNQDLFDPERWGLRVERIRRLPDELRGYWEHYRPIFTTQTRDTSEHAYQYLRGQLTMDKDRHYAGIARHMEGQDGQALQHFMSNSPWSAQGVYRQIQADIAATPLLAQGSWLILDESADEKAGILSAGALRQYNGRIGKVDECQVSVVLGYANWQNPPWPTWALVDSELFLAQEWFTSDFAELRARLGVAEERHYASKAELGLQMVQRAQQAHLPCEGLACDDQYGRDGHFRAELDQAGICYYADVPANTQIYLEPPRIGVAEKRARPGRPTPQPRVLNQARHLRADRVGADPDTQWQRLFIRSNERGVLEDDFAARRVWTWKRGEDHARSEWLILRVERNGHHSYLLSNAPPDTPFPRLAEGSCVRYFVERVIEDAKDENGWDEFQAQKYLAWEHHTALTACALWFIAQTKLSWAQEVARDPQLVQQLEVEVLPALSTANVRELLKAVMPLPQLSPEEARQQVAQHLVNRARSTASRLRHRHRKNVNVQT